MTNNTFLWCRNAVLSVLDNGNFDRTMYGNVAGADQVYNHNISQTIQTAAAAAAGGGKRDNIHQYGGSPLDGLS